MTARIVVLVLASAAATILVWHFCEEYQWEDPLPRINHETSANHFLLFQYYVRSRQQRLQHTHSKEGRAPVRTVAVWEEYLKKAAARDVSEVAGYDIEYHDGLTVLDVRGKNSYVERFLIAVPDGEEDSSNYVAVAYVQFDVGQTVHRAVLAYSPTEPDRLFAGPGTEDTDLTEILFRTVKSYDWSGRFDPPVEEWPDYYPLDGGYGPEGPVTARDAPLEGPSGRKSGHY